MLSLILTTLLISHVFSIPCGEYTTQCLQAGAAYIKYVYVVSVDGNGHASSITQTEYQYEQPGCRGSSYLSFTTKYSVSLHAEGSDNYDDYDLTYKSVSMDVKDKDVFSRMGFTCNTSIKNKSYNLKSVSCDQAKIPYTEVYANSIGTTVENVRIVHTSDSITIMGLSASSSGINGCSGKIAVITIVVIVVVVLVILGLICWCRKSKKN